MSEAPMAVGAGVVVIVVAIAIVLVVLFVVVSMRGRQKRHGAARHELGEAHERAANAERERDIAQQQARRGTDLDR